MRNEKHYLDQICTDGPVINHSVLQLEQHQGTCGFQRSDQSLKGFQAFAESQKSAPPWFMGCCICSLAEEQGYHKGCWITWTHSNADKVRHPQVISLHLQALLATRHLLIPVLCQNGTQNLQGASGIAWCQLLCSLPCGTWLTPPDQSHSLVCGSQGFTGHWCSEQTP